MEIEFKDSALNGLAMMFYMDENPATFRRDLLEVAALDFSVESLLKVDEYLLKIRKKKGIDEEWNRIVLRCGAYVGEVIKQALPEGTYHWVDYETATTIDSMVKDFGYGAGTAAILYHSPRAFVFPLAKVEKCLEYGKADNTHFFAQSIIALAGNELK